VNSTKEIAYTSLVQSRKTCHLCQGLTNPADYANGIFDSDHIGPWSRWQGNLDTKLMIIGQDWGDTGYFQRYGGRETDNNPSNKTIRELLASIETPIPPSSVSDREASIIFMTNAILCLKEGGLAAPVKREWFNNCGPLYLKPLIELVRPKAVVSLGKYAFEMICQLYNLPKMTFREVVDRQEGIPLLKDVLFLPVYHCSPRVLHTHRSLAQQKSDWQRIKMAIQGQASNRGD
jgi:uracil-DNA glycosylase